jgi:hypothetical protein
MSIDVRNDVLRIANISRGKLGWQIRGVGLRQPISDAVETNFVSCQIKSRLLHIKRYQVKPSDTQKAKKSPFIKGLKQVESRN